MTNIYGLDTDYLHKKISLFLERMYNHTPEEAAVKTVGEFEIIQMFRTFSHYEG